MIDKFLKIHNIGLYANGTAGQSVKFGKVTLIYGANGRGKSTLASILRSWSSGNSEELSTRKCLDSSADPVVHLLWKDQQIEQIKFETGAWSSKNPSIDVFDSQFIDDNVYSGFEVAPRQRQRLLEFAIGSQSVRLKKEIDECDANADRASRTMRTNEAVLKAACGSMPLPLYLKATIPDNVDALIEAASRDLESQKDIANIRARSTLEPIDVPTLNLEVLFKTLRRTLPGIEEDAEALVRRHLAKLGHPETETWVKHGLSMVTDDKCPFCDSPLQGLQLISAYRSFFNEIYNKHKEAVERLLSGSESRFGNNALAKVFAQAERNTIIAQGWSAQMAIALPVLDQAQLDEAFRKFFSLLTKLSHTKAGSPLSEVGSSIEEEEADELLKKIASLIQPYNKGVEEGRIRITSYLKSLANGSVQAVSKNLEQLQALKRLLDPLISDAKTSYLAAKQEHRNISDRKAELRKQLNEEMPAFLEKYADRINKQLERFGAQFRIIDLKSSHKGGLPSSNWAVELRGTRIDVAATQQSSPGPSFKTILSDGDRRALAFAFFIARLGVDTAMDQRIVVVDDPVSSLDRSRAKETQRVLIRLAKMCKQLVVLSHDAHCIDDLDTKLRELRQENLIPVILAIDRVERNYSVIAERSLVNEIESDYATNYRLVKTFVDGTTGSDLISVGRSIRPLLEGYLRRKYIGHVDRHAQLYSVVQQIRTSGPGAPLYEMLRHTDELEAVNNDVREFHHDGGGESSSSLVVEETELLTVARRALAIIHAA